MAATADPTSTPGHVTQYTKDRLATLSPLQLALMADQRRAAMALSEAEPIAIVGLGCRFPGAPDPLAFWRLLRDGAESVIKVPADRWDADALYDPNPDRPGRVCTKFGSFLQDIDRFDPQFFGIAPREAWQMDPQQRLVLEVVWEALEHAALAPERLAGTATGLFLGISASDYVHVFLKAQDLDGLTANSGTSGALCVAAGRVSYALGLQGPAVALDTACSSSLVALHLACQSLRRAECDTALAGGVNLILTPLSTVAFSRAHMLAPDGRCKTFDASADGYGRGEGCGIVVLRRLADAIANQDRILAVVRGSAVNHDGRSAGLTVPNGPAQEAVIRRALANGAVASAQVSYVEAHGTGTSLGDPIEVGALASVFAGRTRIGLGSVKTNIGHLEAAAGIASLIKVVLALQHRKIPAHLHFRTPNPHIPWQALPFDVHGQLTNWTPVNGRRIAGISSFGFSGTNAHVLVEEAPSLDREEPAIQRPQHVLCLSARTDAALGELAQRYATHIEAEAASVADICHTAAVGRNHFPRRLAVVGADASRLAERLRAASPQPQPRAAGRDTRPTVAFLFTGQGAQYANMARELFETQPTFRRTLEACDAVFREASGRPLLSAIYPETTADPGVLDQTMVTQPALFAVEYGIATLWKSWGVEPDFVMGHSVGEYVAATVAGAMSFEDALRLVTRRGQLMQSLPAGSAMAAIDAGAEEVTDMLARVGSDCVVAAHNSPSDTTIAGSADAVAAACERFGAHGVQASVLRVSHAFHSAWMDPILDDFERAASGMATNRPAIGLVTNVTGDWLRTAPDAAHWRQHLRQSVRCAQGYRTLAAEGVDVWIEVGPQPALVAYGRRTLNDPKGVWLSSLRKGRSDWQQLLTSLGTLYTLGADIDWNAFDRGYGRRRVALPTYPFQRSRYWVEPAASAPDAAGRSRESDPAVARRLDSPAFANAIVHEHRVGPRSRIVCDHCIGGSLIVPAALYLSLASGAAESLWGSASIESAEFERPLVLGMDTDYVLHVILNPESDRSASFEIAAAPATDRERRWVVHVRGRLTTGPDMPAADVIAGLPTSPEMPLDPSSFYSSLLDSGFEYGSGLRGLIEVGRTRHGASGRIRVPRHERLSQALARVVLLDCGFQLFGAVEAITTKRYVPASVSGVVWFRPVPLESRCELTAIEGNDASDSIAARLRMTDLDGRPVVEVDRVVLRAISPDRSIDRSVSVAEPEVYEIQWHPRPSPEPEHVPGGAARTWVIVGGARGLADRLAGRLNEAGDRCVTLGTTDDPIAMVRSFAGSTGPDAVIHLSTLETPPSAEGDTPSDAQRSVWTSLLALVRTAGHAKWNPRLFVVTRGAHAVAGSETCLEQAPVWGFIRSVRLEHPELRPTLIDLEPGNAARDEACILTEVRAGDVESVAWRGDRRYVPRLARASSADRTGPSTLVVRTPGVLDSLDRPPQLQRPPGPGEVQIAVRATGLNFRDVLTALDLYPGPRDPLGLECAGMVTAVGAGVTRLSPGMDVVALAPASFSTFVTTSADVVRAAPPHVGAAAAATIPVAFLTAAYALRRLARLQAGQRVLIHAASGGVGLAAVQIAQAAGAEVFATAGTEGKRNHLAALGVPYVYDSRTRLFADRIHEATGGRGVDVILNSLTGDFIPIGLSTLAPGGTFVEIGKIGIWDPARVAAARPDVQYRVFDLAETVRDNPRAVGDLLEELLQEVSRGTLQPLPNTVFTVGDVGAAFRLMAQARHIGKVVVTQPAPASAGAVIRHDATYLITGGFGALGRLVARWLIGEGARALVLVGRHLHQDVCVELEALGATVLGIEADVADRSAMTGVLDRIRNTFPRLKGIVHCAGVLDDGVVEEQTWERMKRVVAPKMDGAWNLHQLTRTDELDLFVMFSSAASVFGSPGQIGYAAGNAYLDALSRQRREQGLPALSVNWGPWAGAGMASRLVERAGVIGRAEQLDPAHALTVLHRALARPETQLVVLPSGWTDVMNRMSPGETALIAEHVAPRSGGAERADLSRALAEALPGARRELIARHLEELSRRILDWPPAEVIAHDRPLNELGFDSLMAVELRNAAAHALGRSLPATVLFDYPTIDALAEHLASATSPATRPGPSVASGNPRATDAPIAIVGMACRFPGHADSPAAFWRLLSTGQDAIGEVPPDRWEVEAYYDPGLASTRSMNTRWGGFLDRVDHFDRQFFGISAQEASSMDPQQRLLLEVAWEAFERAGLPPARLAGSPAGVFIGICSCDYSALLSEAPARGGTGLALSIAANRLSYLFDLRGPSLAIDTACSSSLVAVDLACQSLRGGSSRVALAGGVNVILLPETTIAFSQAGMMAPDGRCKTFDARANGYVRSEGCGLIVLKTLADAEQDGDDILAVIRGSAVNQDGRSSGLTAPNGLAQQAVIRSALANGRIRPGDVNYVEAHGTGTPLGDTIEVGALWTVLAEGRSRVNPLVLGSVKTNLGHLEGAAGIAGLMKVVLALNAGEIPPHLHLDQVNPDLALDTRAIEIPTVSRGWTRGGRRRVAGVSSFGFGGTNAHIILEEAPSRTPSPGVPRAEVFTLSARSESALRVLAHRYLEDLANDDMRTIADLCHTSSAGRTHFSHRAALVVESRAQLVRDLRRLAQHDCDPSLISGVVPRDRPKVAFLIPGQADVFPGRARELFTWDPRVRQVLERCGELLHGALERPLLDSLYPTHGDRFDFAGTASAYPIAFALWYAIAELWRSWGLVPDAVCGHGVGDLVAACQAHMIELEEALHLAAAAGRAAVETSDRQRHVDAYRQVAAGVHGRPPAILFASQSTGRVWRSTDAPTIDLWLSHPTRAANPAAAALAEAGCSVFVEMGHGSLNASVQWADAGPVSYHATLAEDGGDCRVMSTTLATLYARGVNLDWTSGHRSFGYRTVSLPTYPFERQRYWIHDEAILVKRARGSLA